MKRKLGNVLSAVLSSFATAALVLPAGYAWSQQDYPNKPIRLVHAVVAGSSADVLGRQVATKIKERTGWTLVVDNRTGADFAPGILAVTQSPADGYTTILGFMSFAILPSMRKNMQWDIKELATVARFAVSPSMISVNNDVPANNLAELIAYSKANPGKLSFGGSPIGGTGHLVAEMIRLVTGLNFVYVPYKDAAITGPDLMSGRTQVAYSGVADFIEFVRAGRMRPIVVLGGTRHPLIPNIPTAVEAANSPDLDIASWFGFLVKTGTPQPIIARLEKEILGAVDNQEMRDWMNKIGVQPLGTMEGADAFRKRLDSDLRRWANVVKAAKIEPE